MGKSTRHFFESRMGQDFSDVRSMIKLSYAEIDTRIGKLERDLADHIGIRHIAEGAGAPRRAQGGKGVLLGGLASVPRGNVVVVGAGSQEIDAGVELGERVFVDPLSGSSIDDFADLVRPRGVEKRDEHEAGWQGCLDGLEKMFL